MGTENNGGKNYKDLTGQRFGRLLVIERADNFTYKDGRTRVKFKCLCDCGNFSEIVNQSLVNNGTQSCGCLKSENTSARKWSGYEEISGVLIGRIKNNAKTRNLEYSVSNEFIWDLFLKQDRKCALTGQDLVFARTIKDLQTASLDRIDSSKGYIEGNVQWIHKDINRLKMDWTLEELYKLCESVINYKNSEKYV